MKTTAELNKAIASIKVVGAKLDGMIQECGVNVIEHFAEYKDTGVVNRLFFALPKGARATAFTSWLLAHCAVVANTDAKSKADQPFVYSREKVSNPLAAAQDMWFNHKPEKAPDEIFDLQKAVRMILAKAGKAPGVSHGDVDTLKALAKCVGIAESDVPTLPKAPAKTEDALV